jgi:tetratricopeptide (TPR) repeat protein
LVAAQQLTSPDQAEARRVLLRAAIQRAPASALPRRVMARELLRDLSDPRCAGEVRSARIEEILSHARTLDAAKPDTTDALEIFASLYTATAQPEEARRVLAPRCPRLEGAEGVRCWRTLLGVVRTHSKENPSAVVSLARQLTSTACTVDEQCDEALIQAADALAEVSEWPLALSYYERAAQINPGARIFLKVAEVASKLGQVAVADRALTRAATRAAGNVKLGRQIAERRQALFRSAVVQP